MKFKFRYILWIVVGMFVFAFYQIFGHSNINSTEDNPLNEYSVYQTSSTNKLVNYKLKEDVKEASQSTNGLQVDSENSSSSSYQVDGGEGRAEVWECLQKWAKAYDTDPVFTATICSLESDFGRDLSTSYANARGYMQITPDPPNQMKQVGIWESDMTMDFHDMENNIRVCTRYLKYGYDTFVVPRGLKDDIGAWAAGYNGWWDKTTKLNPPYYSYSSKADPNENKRYYYMAKLVYDSYISGAKKIGESKDWARQQVGY